MVCCPAEGDKAPPEDAQVTEDCFYFDVTLLWRHLFPSYGIRISSISSQDLIFFSHCQTKLSSVPVSRPLSSSLQIICTSHLIAHIPHLFSYIIFITLSFHFSNFTLYFYTIFFAHLISSLLSKLSALISFLFSFILSLIISILHISL